MIKSVCGECLEDDEGDEDEQARCRFKRVMKVEKMVNEYTFKGMMTASLFLRVEFGPMVVEGDKLVLLVSN